MWIRSFSFSSIFVATSVLESSRTTTMSSFSVQSAKSLRILKIASKQANNIHIFISLIEYITLSVYISFRSSLHISLILCESSSRFYHCSFERTPFSSFSRIFEICYLFFYPIFELQFHIF